jgi:hypothetical protein
VGEFKIETNTWLSALHSSLNGTTENRTVRHKGRGYLCTSQDGQSIEVVASDQLNASRHQLPISKIVETSVIQLEGLRRSRSQGSLSEAEFQSQATDIKTLTDRMIDLRAEKRNRFGWIMLRAIAYAIAAVATLLFGLGIPLWRSLSKRDADFTKETALFQKQISDAYLSATINEAEVIQQHLGRIPAILDEEKKHVSDSLRATVIEGSMQDSYPKDRDSAVAPQFEKDVLRGQRFVRKDKEQGIDDAMPLPPKDLSSEKKVEQGAALLNELVREGDENWRVPLQLAASQTSLNALFFRIKGMLALSEEAGIVSWQDPDSQRSFLLASQFSSDSLPPIHLEIVRNETTRAIEKVKVRVSDSLNLVAREQDNSGKAIMVAPHAITAELEYSITLGKNQEPVISELATHFRDTRLWDMGAGYRSD